MTEMVMIKPGTYDVEITSSRIGVTASGRDVWTLRGRIITERSDHFGAICMQHYTLHVAQYCAERLCRVMRALGLPFDMAAHENAVGRKMTVDVTHRIRSTSSTWIEWNNERLWRDWYARANEMTQEQLDAEHVLLHADSERLMNEAEDAMRRAVYAKERSVKLKSRPQ